MADVETVDALETEAPVVAETAPVGPRVAHDFQRDDLNDLRDAVNELHARG